MITKYLILGLIFLYALFTLLGCGGWNEGSGAGECYVSFAGPLYSAFANLGLIAAFTGFIWVPILIIVDLIFTYVYKKRKKAAALDAGTYVEPVESKSPTLKFMERYLIFIIFAMVVIFAIVYKNYY